MPLGPETRAGPRLRYRGGRLGPLGMLHEEIQAGERAEEPDRPAVVGRGRLDPAVERTWVVLSSLKPMLTLPLPVRR